MMSEPEFFDAIIIGAGPIGLACGIECRKRNLTYLIIEKGCLVNSLYDYPLHMTFFSTSEKLEIGEVPFMSINPKATRSEALEYYRRVAMSWKLNIRLFEEVQQIDQLDGNFQVHSSKGTYSCASLVISTGFYDIPNRLGITGEDLPKVKHYYVEAHPFFGQKLAVVGSANSAVDVALECYRKGAQVTMIIKNEEFRDNVKYWVKPDIENRIKEGSIKAFFSSSITEIRENEILIHTPQGPVTLENDFVMAMTGYLPDFTFLKNLGIELQNDPFTTPCYDPQTMETNQKNIYLAGVVCGGLNTRKWFIENSRIHAEIIAESIFRKSKSIIVTNTIHC